MYIVIERTLFENIIHSRTYKQQYFDVQNTTCRYF